MSTDTDNDQNLDVILAPVLRVLSRLHGHFVFSDSTGEQFVVMAKHQFDALSQKTAPAQRQLPLAPIADKAEEDDQDAIDITMDIVNREIALSSEPVSEEESLDDLALGMEGEPELVEDKSIRREYEQPSLPPIRVKFEAIRGDLPPELQE